MSTLKTTITKAVPDKNGDYDYIELPVTVEFTYYAACKGHRDKYGAPEEPDEPAYVEVDSVTDKEGNEISLTEKEEESLIEECFESLGKDYDS